MTCRAKAYLLSFIILKQQNDLLVSFTNSKLVQNQFNLAKFAFCFIYLFLISIKIRLINSLERDQRKSFPIKEENDFIQKTIEMLLDLLTTIADSVLGKKYIVLIFLNLKIY